MTEALFESPAEEPIPSSAAPTPVGVANDDVALIAGARRFRAEKDAADLNLAHTVLAWVGAHGVDDIDVQTDPMAENVVPVAGPGAPLLPEFELEDLVQAIGFSHHAGWAYVGSVVELARRLPRLWAHVRSGRCPLWRALAVAQATRGLPAAAADRVDAQVWWCVPSTTAAQLGRILDAALAAVDPDRAAAVAAARAEQRHVSFGFDDVGVDGTVWLEAGLDLADALDLEAAVADNAAELGRLGSSQSLDVRRSMALGEIARRDATLEFPAIPGATASGGQGGDVGPAPARRETRPRRRVVLHLHLSAQALTGAASIGRLEQLSRPVLAEVVRSWCRSAGAITVRPVIDLAGHEPVDAYEIPARVRAQVDERDPHCVFPRCTRPAAGCDGDHIEPFDHGDPATGAGPPPGQTHAAGIAPLCRFHHRAKTHSSWTHAALRPGSYVWTSPTGHHYLVDDTGTLDITDRLPPTGRRRR